MVERQNGFIYSSEDGTKARWNDKKLAQSQNEKRKRGAGQPYLAKIVKNC